MRHTCNPTRGAPPSPRVLGGGHSPRLGAGRRKAPTAGSAPQRQKGGRGFPGGGARSPGRHHGFPLSPGQQHLPAPAPSAGEAQARWSPPRRRRLRGQAEARRGAPAAGFRHRRKAALLPLPPLGARPAPTQRRGRVRQRRRLLPARGHPPAPNTPRRHMAAAPPRS